MNHFVSSCRNNQHMLMISLIAQVFSLLVEIRTDSTTGFVVGESDITKFHGVIPEFGVSNYSSDMILLF